MTLICGTGSACLCPTCLIPLDKLSDLSVVEAKHTTNSMKAILDQAKGLRKKEDQEELLKSYSLHGIEVSQLKSNFNLTLVLNLAHRISFGHSTIPTFIPLFLGTTFMHTMEVYSDIIYGISSSILSMMILAQNTPD